VGDATSTTSQKFELPIPVDDAAAASLNQSCPVFNFTQGDKDSFPLDPKLLQINPPLLESANITDGVVAANKNFKNLPQRVREILVNFLKRVEVWLQTEPMAEAIINRMVTQEEVNGVHVSKSGTSNRAIAIKRLSGILANYLVTLSMGSVGLILFSSNASLLKILQFALKSALYLGTGCMMAVEWDRMESFIRQKPEGGTESPRPKK